MRIVQGGTSPAGRKRHDERGAIRKAYFPKPRNCVHEAIADGKENGSCKGKEPVLIPDRFAAFRAMASQLLAIHTGI